MRKLAGNELGWRLAGLADGEGCFAISRNHRKGTHQCCFIVGMRADDRPFLELMCASTGLGVVRHVMPTALTLQRRPGTNPQTHWRVERKAEVVALVRLFDRYPPLSKKACDYVIWRDAVRAWAQLNQGRMAELRLALMASRRFTVDDAPTPPIDPQLSIDEAA